MPDNNTQNEQSNIPEVFSYESYILDPINTAYNIYDPNGRLALYANVKSSWNLDIRVYKRKGKWKEVLAIQRKKRGFISYPKVYNVFESTIYTKLGAFKRDIRRSLLIEEMIIMDAEDREIGQTKAISEESSQILKLLTMPQKFYGEVNGKLVFLIEMKNGYIKIDFSKGKKGLLDRRL